MSNHYSSFDSEQHLLDKVELFPGITIVWKRRSRRRHDRAIFQVGCANSISAYVQSLFFAKLFDVLNYVENTPTSLQGYETTSYGKLRVIVLFHAIGTTLKKK